MTTKEAIALISNPGKINAQHAEGLEELVNRYPWFSTAHILLAKAYKNAGRHSYRSLLKKASLYAGDRTLLYELMESPADHAVDTGMAATEEIPDTKTIDLTPDQASSEKIPEAEKTLPELPATNGKSPERKEEQLAKQPVEESSGHAIEDFLKSFGVDPVHVEEKVQEEEAEREISLYPTDNEKVDAEINELEDVEAEPEITGEEVELEEAIPFKTRGLTIEGGEADDEDEPDVREEDKVASKTRPEIIYDPLKELSSFLPDIEEETADREHLIFTPVYNPEVELARYMKSEDEENLAEDVHSFLNWLDEFSEYAKNKDRSWDTAEPEDTITAEEEIKLEEKQEIQEKPGKKPDPEQLLEAFLRKKPRITRMKAEFYTPESMARKSESDDSDIVSESLANLLLKQNHPEKAIEVYEKLKLQKPTKLAYFAARIEEIRAKYNIE